VNNNQLEEEKMLFLEKLVFSSFRHQPSCVRLWYEAWVMGYYQLEVVVLCDSEWTTTSKRRRKTAFFFQKQTVFLLSVMPQALVVVVLAEKDRTTTLVLPKNQQGK
jgi:hypothetical protein